MCKSICGKNRVDIGLFVLRVALAMVFIYHGVTKMLIVESDGSLAFGFTQTISNFGMIGLSAFMAYLVTILEVIVGFMLLLGFMTNIAAWICAGIMVGAIYFVHGKNGYGGPGGYEFQLVLLLLSIAVAHLGAGRFAICKDFGNPVCPVIPDGQA